MILLHHCLAKGPSQKEPKRMGDRQISTPNRQVTVMGETHEPDLAC